MRMARVNITVPDEIAMQARAAGLNVSRVASLALAGELERLAKIDALDAYLAKEEAEHGPISAGDQAEADRWAERVFAKQTPRRRRSA
jgi:post-segregation antitoxin (ccd killing protein)